MILPQHRPLICSATVFLVLLSVLAGCGSAPQSTTQEQNLQATVVILQTQVADRPEPTAIQAVTAPTQVSTSVVLTQAASPTPLAATTATSNTKEYVGERVEEGHKAALYLHWTEENGQITGELIRAGFNPDKFNIQNSPITGTRNGSTLNLVIEQHSKATATITEDGKLELRNNEGTILVTLIPGTKQDFDKKAEEVASSVTPKNLIVGKWKSKSGAIGGSDPSKMFDILEFREDGTMISPGSMDKPWSYVVKSNASNPNEGFIHVKTDTSEEGDIEFTLSGTTLTLGDHHAIYERIAST